MCNETAYQLQTFTTRLGADGDAWQVRTPDGEVVVLLLHGGRRWACSVHQGWQPCPHVLAVRRALLAALRESPAAQKHESWRQADTWASEADARVAGG